MVGLPEVDAFYLRVTREGYADLLLGPLSAASVGGGSEHGLELALGAGGALEGRVLLEEGSGEGAIVAVHFGDGRPRTQRAGPDGRFRFEGLPAGRCRVERVDEEVVPGTRTLSFGGAAETPTFDVSVREGGVTVHDLDLRSGR